MHIHKYNSNTLMIWTRLVICIFLVFDRVLVFDVFITVNYSKLIRMLLLMISANMGREESWSHIMGNSLTISLTMVHATGHRKVLRYTRDFKSACSITTCNHSSVLISRPPPLSKWWHVLALKTESTGKVDILYYRLLIQIVHDPYHISHKRRTLFHQFASYT